MRRALGLVLLCAARQVLLGTIRLALPVSAAQRPDSVVNSVPLR